MSTASALPQRLPPLREDLQLHPAARQADGSPAWVVQDPATNEFFRIGWLEFELLGRWDLAEPQALLQATADETLLSPTEAELADLYAFLLQHQLLDLHHPDYTRSLLQRHRQRRPGVMHWLLHHYLFFRLPLLRPGAALQRLLPALRWVYTRTTAVAVGLLSLLGLVLTARQWDHFAASFVDTLTPAGLLGYLAALAVTKSLHELGHALTATRHGLRVAHMGVAFVVMWPMLYTDTGESWRLSDNRHRLQIASAGIVTELALAGLALLAWNLTAEGELRQALFFLATTAWVMTLALNASPFMRFDGYFILSDLLDMPNLHERASALARASLRRRLLGWDEPDPEGLSPRRRRALVAFAAITWLYRLAVFVGIAVAVYLFFFKLLGIVLFIVELAWFVVLPIWRELRVWRARRGEIPRRRWRAAGLLAGGLLLLGLLPLPWSVPAPGWARPVQAQLLYSPLPARLVSVPAPGAVAAGAPLFVLEQPELAHKARLADTSAEALAERLRGLSGLQDGEAQRAILQRLWAQQQAELLAQRDEAARLVLRAPFAGQVTDRDPSLAPGVWVAPGQPLAAVVAGDRWQAEAYIAQDDRQRVQPGAAVRFHVEGEPLTVVHGTVVAIDDARLSALPHPLLASRHGGPIPVLADPRQLTARDTLYRVRIRLERPPGPPRMLRGQVVIQGRAQSWLLQVLRPAVLVAVRELNF